MTSIKTKSFNSWIIGYGNTQCRDDGIGPYVVGRLNELLKHKNKIHILELRQLEPDLIHELRHAHFTIFVDATMDELDNGWNWVEVKPKLGDLPYTTHHLEPSSLLGLLQSLYHRYPRTWLVSIQGYDFGFGEGLTPEAEKRADNAVSEIVNFVLTKTIKTNFFQKTNPVQKKEEFTK